MMMQHSTLLEHVCFSLTFPPSYDLLTPGSMSELFLTFFTSLFNRSVVLSNVVNRMESCSFLGSLTGALIC